MSKRIALCERWLFRCANGHDVPFFAAQAGFNDDDWRSIDLPHDWSVEGDLDPKAIGGNKNGYLPTGIGWYRKHFHASADWKNQSIEVCFDGIFRCSDVWINGVHLGYRANGWAAFSYELAPHLNFDGENVLVVRVDNSRQPAARWYTGSGINRPVHLDIRACRELRSAWVDTIRLDQDQAEIKVQVATFGDVETSFELSAPDGSIVAYGRPGTFTIPQPQLWSPETPALYTCRVLSAGGDVLERRIGIRTAVIDDERGLLLNGRVDKFKGFCLHEDAGALGTAVPEKIWRFKLNQLKRMGCNALRVGHHRFPAVFYDLCDELGFLVMDEFFDGWDQPKATEDYGHDFHRDWLRHVDAMIEQHRHHACIVVWSIGNEVHGVNEEKTAAICAAIKAHDTTRPVTMGRGYQRALDVAGFNGHGEKPGVLESYREQNPGKPIVLTEEPHLYTTRGFYRTLGWIRNPGSDHYPILDFTEEEIFTNGDTRFASSYDNCTSRITAQDCWRRTAETPWISGQFQWTAFEYYGECEYHGSQNQESISRYGNRGVIDAALIEKDLYYYYQSQWASGPMLHLLPHWTHPNLPEGTEIPIHAYTNGSTVELWLNGESLGRQDVPTYGHGSWLVPWKPGTLRAEAYDAGGKIVAEAEVHSAGAATGIRLASDDKEIAPQRGDVTRLLITAVDAAGVPVPSAESLVHVITADQLAVRGSENGNRLDLTPPRSERRRLFAGQGAWWLMSTADTGACHCTAIALHGQSRFAESTTIAISIESLNLRGEPTTDTAGYKIHFTTDGSEPTADALLFNAPLTIKSTTRLRLLILNGDAVVTTFDETFECSELEPAVQLGHRPGADQLLDGVRDEEVIGLWTTGKKQFRFADDGNVFAMDDSGVPDRCGQWWYDFPNDLDEDPEDTGTGELAWTNGRRASLRLVSREANVLEVFPSGGGSWNLKRVSESE